MKKVVVILLVLIIVLASFLRFWRVDFDVDYPYNPDDVYFISPVFNVMNFNQPGWYGAPGTTLVYANTVIFYAVGLFIDAPGSVAEKYENDPTYFDLTARLFYELIGLLTVLLVFILVNKIFNNNWIGLLSSLTLAISVLHVEHSHYIRPDILATFFLVLLAYFGWEIYKTGKLKNYLLAGCFLALAITTKYPAVIGILFIITPHLMRYLNKVEDKLFNKKLIYTLLFTLLVFTIIFPYYITDFDKLIDNLKWESRSIHGEATSQGFLDNILFYIKGSFWYTGTLLFFFSLLGIRNSLIKRQKTFYFLFPFVIIFFIFISLLSLQWDRWFIMLLPFMAIFSGLGIYASLVYLKKILNHKKIIFYLLSTCILLLIFYPAFLRSFRQSYALGHKDTRDFAMEWAINNLDSSKSAVIEDNSPKLYNYFDNVEKLSTSSIKFPDYWKNEKNMDYQIVNSYIYERILNNPYLISYYKDSYKNLFNDYNLIMSFEYPKEYKRDIAIEKNDIELLINKKIFDFKTFSGPIILFYEL